MGDGLGGWGAGGLYSLQGCIAYFYQSWVTEFVSFFEFGQVDDINFAKQNGAGQCNNEGRLLFHPSTTSI